MKNDCQKAEVPCPNKGCGKLVAKQNLDKHLQQCGYGMFNCQWCKQNINFDQKKVRNAMKYV